MTMIASLPLLAAPARGGYVGPAQRGYVIVHQNYITEDEALEAALQHAGVAARDICRPWVHLDNDDGRQVYEVEFCVGWTEYSYDVDAATGRIVSGEADRDD